MTSMSRKSSRKQAITAKKTERATEKAAVARQAASTMTRRRQRSMVMASRGVLAGGLVALLAFFLVHAVFSPALSQPPTASNAQAAADAAAAATEALRAKAAIPAGSGAGEKKATSWRGEKKAARAQPAAKAKASDPTTGPRSPSSAADAQAAAAAGEAGGKQRTSLWGQLKAKAADLKGKVGLKK